jgi:hypothetical protein
LDESPERSLLARYRQNACAIANTGLNNSSTGASAAPDHDHVLVCQLAHFLSPVVYTFMCKTGVAAETHRCAAAFGMSAAAAPA